MGVGDLSTQLAWNYKSHEALQDSDSNIEAGAPAAATTRTQRSQPMVASADWMLVFHYAHLNEELYTQVKS